MTVPIIPAGPVSNVITIQPVTTTIPNREQGGSGNPLSALPQGTSVQGFVVNRDAQNNPILRTPLGDLRITSEVFLKTGSEVIFRVDNSQSSLARIVTVDGLSTQNYSAQSSRGLTRDTITPNSLQASTTSNPIAQAANIAAGTQPNATVFQGIVLQGAAATQAPSLLANALAAAQSGPLPIVAQLAQLRAGASVKLTLLDLKLPPIAIPLGALPESNNLSSLLTPQRPAAQNTAAPTGTPPPAQQAIPAQASSALPQEAINAQPATASQRGAPSQPNAAGAQQSAIPAAALPTSAVPLTPAATAQALPASQISGAPIAANPAATAPLTVTPSATRPATQPATPELTKPTAPNQIVATVIGHDADGANILQTPFASLKIYTPQPLPTGTTLLVRAEFAATPANAPMVSQGALTASTLPMTPSQSLATLGETITWLQTNQPDVAHDASLRLPNITHQLANGLLNYIIGIRSGDIGDIIGKRAMRLLEISNPELLSRIRQQVDQLQGSFIDSPSTQWNMLPVPLFFGGELHAAKLFIHKDPPEESASTGATGRGQRFILEVAMSQLGPLQFDGFVRNQERGKSFDLMVRSTEPLPADVSAGIRDIFSNSMEATRMHGQVMFQPGTHHFVKPDAPSSPFSGTGVNTILA